MAADRERHRQRAKSLYGGYAAGLVRFDTCRTLSRFPGVFLPVWACQSRQVYLHIWAWWTWDRAPVCGVVVVVVVAPNNAYPDVLRLPSRPWM